MDRLGVKRLVVVDDNDNLVGIVSRRDLLKVFLRSDDDIREEIRREVFARLLWADPTLVDIDVRDGIVVLSGEVEQRSSIDVAVRLTRAPCGVLVRRSVIARGDAGDDWRARTVRNERHLWLPAQRVDRHAQVEQCRTARDGQRSSDRICRRQ